jgi:GT2 family glycosyltransferase
MAKKEPLVAVIITNYNGASVLYKSKSILWHCFSSVAKTNYKNYKVFFGDDSSTDNSVEYVKKSFPKTDIIINKPNGGYTRCSNTTIKHSLKEYDPDYIVTLNNDIIISDRNWLRKLVDVAESKKEIGIVGCKFLYPDGRLQHAGVEDTYVMLRCRGWNTHDADKYNEIEEVPAVGMVVCIVKRAVIDKIGLLDENFYQGSDDLDFCVRARKKGFKVMYDGQLSIIHLEGYTAKALTSTSSNKDFWYTILQINFVYSSFKRLGTKGRIHALAITLVSAFIGIGNRQMTISNIQFKTRPVWRLKETMKAIWIGYRLYKGAINRDQAYGPYLKRG